jgi:hypothetical protein
MEACNHIMSSFEELYEKIQYSFVSNEVMEYVHFFLLSLKSWIGMVNEQRAQKAQSKDSMKKAKSKVVFTLLRVCENCEKM